MRDVGQYRVEEEEVPFLTHEPSPFAATVNPSVHLSDVVQVVATCTPKQGKLKRRRTPGRTVYRRLHSTGSRMKESRGSRKRTRKEKREKNNLQS